MNDKFVLDDQGNPVLEPDLMKWSKWFEQSEKRVLARDDLGNIRVSTVFLGLDHSFGSGPPLLWETMIFGGKHDDYQKRYSTRDEALAGHRHAVWLASN